MAWGCWEREGGGGAGRRKGSCWSEHCCGSGKKQIVLLREQTLLRQWGNTEKAPAGAGTAAARGNTEKAPAGAGTAAAVRKNSWGDCVGGRGGGGGVTERRGCYGVSEVYSKGDGRLGSGGLP